MNESCDVLIVGGGVIGLLTARELVAEGLSVTLLERDRIGMASSQAGGGILSPIPPWAAPDAVTALANFSADRYAKLAASLQESTGVDIEYLSSGALLLGEAISPAVQDWATQAGQSLAVLDRSQLHDRESQLNDHWDCAIDWPGLAQLRNPRLTQALHQDLKNAGAVIVEGAAVTRILRRGDRVTGVRTTDGDFMAGRVVIATGAWTSALLGRLSVADIKPVRGQMLWYQLAPGTFNRIIIAGEQYLIPRRDGVCLIGSTVEQVGFDNGTTAEAGASLATVAGRFSSVFEHRQPGGQWSGLRPGTKDGVPVISAHPGLEGLFINAGHYRNGINLGPASAALMADLILAREPCLEPSPYTSLKITYNKMRDGYIY